jgi:hypothetical protein
MYRAAAVLLELKLEMLSLWQMALQWMLLAWSAEMLLIMLAEELGMNLLVVSVCLVSTVVSQTCVDTSSLLTTAYAP